MNWEIVIGLEVHTQLSTNSKIFSGAPIAFGAAPNTQACAVDLALPGVLPVLNKGAVECAIKFGLAVGAHIAPRSVFARKNYFYPDLPKGYQISQFDLPVVGQGELTIQVEPLSGNGKPYEKVVRITRAHLEEDAGKSIHGGAHSGVVGLGVVGSMRVGVPTLHNLTGIDLNRAGTPLLEIVSEPDMRSAAEAVAYAKALHSLVRWIGICDGNMQEGSFRCDANVSVRRPGEALGTRREIKNLNSFRFMQQAIEYETQWQIDTLENGGKIQQATVLFDSDKCETRAMRSKEDAHDYRYFPDPDLLPLDIDNNWIEQLRTTLPELPSVRCERYKREFDLSTYDAGVLTASREMADYFEIAAKESGNAKLAANWIMGEVFAWLKRIGFVSDCPIADCPITAPTLAQLLRRIQDGTLSGNMAKEVFAELWNEPLQSQGITVDAIIEAKGLKQISDSATIEKLVDEIIAANPAQVAEYRSGKEKVFGYFVGLAMKASKGKANPAQMNEVLKRKLGS